MITNILAPLSAQVTVTTAVNLNGATLMRVLNTSGSTVKVSITDGGSTTHASFSMLNNTVEYVKKNPQDFIACSKPCLVTKVGF